MINRLSIKVDEKNKTCYCNSIKYLSIQLGLMTYIVTNRVKSAFERAKNNVENVDDARKTTKEILGILESTQGNFNAIRLNFINSYHEWLSQVSSHTKTNGTEPVIDLEDPNVSDIEILQDSATPDIQIVNEVRYINRSRASRSNDSVQGDEQSHIPPLSSSQPSASNERSSNCDAPLSLTDNSFEALVNNIEQFDTRKTPHCTRKLDSHRNKAQENETIEGNGKYCSNETESSSNSQDCVVSEKEFEEMNQPSSNQDYMTLNKEQIQEITHVPLPNLRIKPSDYLDEKIRLRCCIQLNRLPEENWIISRSSKKKAQSTCKDSAFLRLVNLSDLEKRTNKRCYSSLDEDESCSSTTSSSSFSMSKKRGKRPKMCSDESDITSIYESSSSDSDDNLGYENEELKEPIFEKLDENEEKAKSSLLNGSDTSDDSDGLIDEEDEDKCNDSNKKKIKSSASKKSKKEKSSRSAWLNDKLLKFRLPSDKEKISRQDVDDLGSGNDTEITEPKNDESLLSTDSKEMETPKSKVVGRRNIRQVRDMAEITRQVGKNEDIRIQRLAERKKQLHSLTRSDANLDEESLTLDFDFKTAKKLVQVDRGLVKLLKAHQKEGVRFMWDSCFESVAQAKTQKGSGCILAHCMGLGKTLQVIALVHTLMSNETIGTKTVMIVCPKNTILNWVDEFDTWLREVDNKSNVAIVELTQLKETPERISKLESWQKDGGVLIISYEMLVSLTSLSKKSFSQMKKMNSLLINPGADLVVCDEGHLLKNETSKKTIRMQSVATQRRIILTGTPLQNNLNEYHCMLEFVKPSLLGSKAEFFNRFANPITNGQFDNSMPCDVKLMKHRAYVLHRKLEGCVQRCDYAVLTPLLPPKQEYVISVRLSDLQTSMYKYFISNVAQISNQTCLFKSYEEIKRLVAHPKVLLRERQKQLSKQKGLRDQAADSNETNDWWRELIKEQDLQDMNHSFKLILLFGLLESCAEKQDKMLVFSQSLATLNLIESFLKKRKWKLGSDYFRLDGKVDSNKRSEMYKAFNDPNDQAKLFLISTKAGGLGINLTGANRVVVFDPSWNPSNDLQSIFRVFRFGQKKPCYIYRFLAAGTMEEKIYLRQVTKLSLSLRVLDEQQVGRHYRDTDLTELYKFEPLSEAPLLTRPKDDLLAEVFSKHGECVYKFFEHDSLLENQEEEELNEEERNQAWSDYYQENLAEPSTDANQPKPKTTRKKLSESSSVEGSNTVADSVALPIDEMADLGRRDNN